MRITIDFIYWVIRDLIVQKRWNVKMVLVESVFLRKRTLLVLLDTHILQIMRDNLRPEVRKYFLIL